MNIMKRAWREEKLLAWSFGGLWVFITAFLWAPSRDGLESVYALAFFIPILFLLAWNKVTLYFNCGWYFPLAMAYGGYAALTTLWSAAPDFGYFILQVIILFSWLYGITWVVSRKDFSVDRLLNWLIVVGVLVGISLVVVFYSKNDVTARLFGWSILRNPNLVGAAFGVLTLFAYLKWLEAKAIKQNTVYFCAMVLLAVPLVLSQSRGALFAFFVVAALALFYVRPSRTKILFHVVLALTILVGVLIKHEELATILASRLDDGYRLQVWSEIFYRSVNEHFWFGIGMEKEGRIIIPDVDVFNHAHNAWLDIFYRTGFVGLVLALLHLFYLLGKFSPSKQLLPLYLWLLYGCLTAMVDSRGFFWQIDARWFLYWIPVGLITALQIVSHSSFSGHIVNTNKEANR